MQNENLIPANTICLRHNIELSFIYSLHEYGLVEIINEEENIFIYADQLNEVEKMIRLHNDLDINMEGLDVIIRLLQKFETTQQQMNELKNKLRFYERE
jgi:hypothetical protein